MPTKANLFRLTVIDNPLCDRCKATSETTLHALWECPVLDEVWADASKWGWRRETAFEGFKELILWIMQNKKKCRAVCNDILNNMESKESNLNPKTTLKTRSASVGNLT